MSFQLIATLVIIIATIIMFISGKVDFGLICMFIIIGLSASGVLTATDALASFSNVNVILCAAMFVIGAGITKTGIVTKVTALVLRFKDKPYTLVGITCIVGSLISAFVTPVMAVPVLLPLIIELSKETGLSRSRLLYPMTACVNAAAGVTIMGMGAFNLISNDLMMQSGATTPLSMMDFTIARTPFVIIAIVYMAAYGYKRLPNLPDEAFDDQHFSSPAGTVNNYNNANLATVISAVTIIMLLISDFIHLPAWLIACTGAAVFVVTNILKPKEAYDAIHLPTIFLFAGILTLTTAMNTSGVANIVGQVLTTFLGGHTNPYFILFTIMLTTMVMTQFMSNMIIIVFSGIAAMVAVQLGIDPRAAVMGVQIAGSASILTPMASPVQAMVMAPGKYELKDFLKSGLPLTIITLITATFFLPILFPFY